MNSREEILLKRDKYHGQETAEFLMDTKRLEKGEPLDYVIGWRDFLGCRIDLSERPLIPREETEFWTEKFIKELKKKKSKVKILDIFAGSGCIGLAVLKRCPLAIVTFVDSENNCLRQIEKNLKINQLKAEVFQSDIFSANLDKFYFILANPPYIPKKGRGSRVQKNVTKWEPAKALWAGADGLKLIRNFLAGAKNHLTPAGEIWLEFGYGQKTKIEKLLRENGYRHWQFHCDQFGRWRFVVIKTNL